ncbi:rCG26435 [Rattus norvegicus]|uniref:RCG26435 n=1 Tax=Rattus norvegicus TaxID=10116 RepID=A6HQL2_RAT|nr:rCG26435 [Rattus norvegicus]
MCLLKIRQEIIEQKAGEEAQACVQMLSRIASEVCLRVGARKCLQVKKYSFEIR